MAKRTRQNKNFGRPMQTIAIKEPTKWEVMLNKLGLTEEESINHPVAQQWAITNKQRSFVPEAHLKYWGIEVDDFGSCFGRNAD